MTYNPAQTQETLEKAKAVISLKARGMTYAQIGDALGGLSTSRVWELLHDAWREGLEPSKPRAVGAYIFAGGFTAGVSRYFDVLTHLEGSDYGVATSKHNHEGLEAFIVPEEWPLDQLAGAGVEFLYANPPCAPWSLAAVSWKSKRDYSKGFDERDERVQCLFNAVNAADVLQPFVFAWESVTRAWSSGRPLINKIARRFMDQGYHFSVVLHNAHDCGVPQIRKRAFFVAHKVEINWQPPKESGPKTVGEAWEEAGLMNLVPDLDDLPPLTSAEDHILAQCSPGSNLRRRFDELYPNPERNERGHAIGRPGFLKRRLAFDKASPTHTGGPTLYHPTEHRYITVKEAQVLCGYPVDYEILGSLSGQFAQVSQAVMPPVGAWLAKTVRAALDDPEPVGEPLYRQYDFIRHGKAETLHPYPVVIDPEEPVDV